MANDPAANNRKARFSWALYDWAINGFATVILTFLFSAYFVREVAEDPASGTSQWGATLAVAGIAVAVIAPFAGAISDRGGPVKPWLATATATGALATAGLWFVLPEPSAIPLALVLVALANFSLELGHVFYNAMLPRLVPPSRLGRLSGRGMALGYLGGLVCLTIALVGFVRIDPAPFGLDAAAREPVRVIGPLVAVWLTVFALPLFLFTPDRTRSDLSVVQALRSGLMQMRDTVWRIKSYGNLVRFLLARLFYIDGLGTVFAFGGIYAAGTFDMTVEEVLYFGIALNVTAGLGAFLFGWVDDRIGARRTIFVGLAGLICLGTPLLIVEGEQTFWILAVALGLFIGPVQSASRSLLARLAPIRLQTQMFGFFTMSGKVTAFAGPALVAILTSMTDSQRIGFSVVILFFLVGGVLLLGVREADS